MTESERLAELRYIYGFSFFKLDKKVNEPVSTRTMSAREINRMLKRQKQMARLHPGRGRVG